MKTFYLLRHEDVHGRSGIGVVAEGIIFDSGMAAMTWLSKHSTVTVFDKIKTVKDLHGHEGKTDVVVEGKDKRWEECRTEARRIKTDLKRKAEEEKK